MLLKQRVNLFLTYLLTKKTYEIHDLSTSMQTVNIMYLFEAYLNSTKKLLKVIHVQYATIFAFSFFTF